MSAHDFVETAQVYTLWQVYRLLRHDTVPAQDVVMAVKRRLSVDFAEALDQVAERPCSAIRARTCFVRLLHQSAERVAADLTLPRAQ